MIICQPNDDATPRAYAEIENLTGAEIRLQVYEFDGEECDWVTYVFPTSPAARVERILSSSRLPAAEEIPLCTERFGTITGLPAVSCHPGRKYIVSANVAAAAAQQGRDLDDLLVPYVDIDGVIRRFKVHR